MYIYVVMYVVLNRDLVWLKSFDPGRDMGL